MPQMTTSDVHVSTALTNISIAYMQSADKFVASRVFPNIPVAKKFDRYYTYDRGDFNRVEMRERAPGTESAGGGFGIDNTPNYSCRVFSVHKDVDEQLRANADSVLNVDRDAVNWLTLQALLKRETMFATAYMAPGVWTNDWAGVASGPTGSQVLQWNDANSTPIEDIRKLRRAVLESTGFEPNKLTLGRSVFDALLDHPDIIDRLKAGQTPGGPAMADQYRLAQLFGVDEVLVMNAIQNTGKEGQVAAHSFIGGKKALLTYSPPQPGLLVPSAGYTFSWTGYLGAGAEGNRIKSIPMPWLEVQRLEIDMAMDQKVVAPDLGAFVNNAVA